MRIRCPFKLGLFGRVVIAILAGAVLGQFAPDVVVRIFKTFNAFFAQALKFIVPLLILALVTPAIADVGRGAGKLLVSVMGGAYLSSVAAGLFAYGLSSQVFPGWLPTGVSAAAQGGREFLPYFSLKIPPVCDVMTALAFSFMAGIGLCVTGGQSLRKVFDDLAGIVKLTIERAVIPLLPVYVFSMILRNNRTNE